MDWWEQSMYWHSPHQTVQLHRYQWSHNGRRCSASQHHSGHHWRDLLPETITHKCYIVKLPVNITQYSLENTEKTQHLSDIWRLLEQRRICTVYKSHSVKDFQIITCTFNLTFLLPSPLNDVFFTIPHQKVWIKQLCFHTQCERPYITNTKMALCFYYMLP